MTVRYAIDSLAIRGDRLFGWGWFMRDQSPTEQVELHIQQGSEETIVSSLHSGTRPDLAHAHPEIQHAATSGFMLVGRIPQPDTSLTASLMAHFADGTTEVRELPDFPKRYMAQVEQQGKGLMGLARRIHSHLRQHGFLSTSRRAFDFALVAFSNLRTATTFCLYQSTNTKRPLVVFDHRMGGGANRFREEWVAQRVAEGCVVHVLSPSMSHMTYEIESHLGRNKRTRIYPELASALSALTRLGVSDIAINDLVSFDAPLEVIHWSCAQKKRGAHLTFFLHDYFAACPSWTLIDDRGRYCAIPSIDRCRECLGRNPILFHSFYGDVSIEHWRAAWQELLHECDNIIAFSRASTAILLKAYPGLDPGAIIIQPHRIDYLDPDARARPSFEVPLVIGIVGHISTHKGAGILRAMVDEVRKSGARLRFKIFGSVDNMPSSDIVDVVGPYRTEQLPDLLEGHGVGICLLPSVCPETFSYVTAEIIHLGMPLAVFDLGAPAERARDYALGRVLTSMEPEEVIKQLLEFGEDLKARRNTIAQSSCTASGPCP